MSRSRGWCFTLNNYTEEEYNKVVACDKFTYIVVGVEVGESGTPHLQGYIEFENARAMSGVKKMLSDRCHLEVRKGTPRQASEYCKKEGQFVEHGKLSSQGHRTDLNELKNTVLASNDTDDAVVLEHFDVYCRYKNGIDRLFDIRNRSKKRTEMTKGIWLWGATGVGKSHTAFELAGDDMFVWTDDNGWWDGYHGQKTVVINDFRGGIKYNELLQMVS